MNVIGKNRIFPPYCALISDESTSRNEDFKYNVITMIKEGLICLMIQIV